MSEISTGRCWVDGHPQLKPSLRIRHILLGGPIRLVARHYGHPRLEAEGSRPGLDLLKVRPWADCLIDNRVCSTKGGRAQCLSTLSRANPAGSHVVRRRKAGDFMLISHVVCCPPLQRWVPIAPCSKAGRPPGGMCRIIRLQPWVPGSRAQAGSYTSMTACPSSSLRYVRSFSSKRFSS